MLSVTALELMCASRGQTLRNLPPFPHDELLSPARLSARSLLDTHVWGYACPRGCGTCSVFYTHSGAPTKSRRGECHTLTLTYERARRVAGMVTGRQQMVQVCLMNAELRSLCTRERHLKISGRCEGVPRNMLTSSRQTGSCSCCWGISPRAWPAARRNGVTFFIAASCQPSAFVQSPLFPFLRIMWGKLRVPRLRTTSRRRLADELRKRTVCRVCVCIISACASSTHMVMDEFQSSITPRPRGCHDQMIKWLVSGKLSSRWAPPSLPFSLQSIGGR